MAAVLYQRGTVCAVAELRQVENSRWALEIEGRASV